MVLSGYAVLQNELNLPHCFPDNSCLIGSWPAVVSAS